MIYQHLLLRTASSEFKSFHFGRLENKWKSTLCNQPTGNRQFTSTQRREQVEKKHAIPLGDFVVYRKVPMGMIVEIISYNLGITLL
jgi:hypothetical protein